VTGERLAANGQGLAFCGGIWKTSRPGQCLVKLQKLRTYSIAQAYPSAETDADGLVKLTSVVRPPT